MMDTASNGATNQLAAGEGINPCGKKVDDMEKPGEGGGSQPPARRRGRRSREGMNGGLSNSLTKSLRGDRRAGLEATRGRLSVSFSDNKGLSAAQIGDILSGFPDGEDEPVAELGDLVGGGDKRKGGGGGAPSRSSTMNMRMKLMTIQSQRAVNFDIDPKDLEDSDDE